MEDEDLRRQLGQLFIVGFRALVATDEIKSLIKAPYYCGTIILFQRNIESAEQLIALINDLQQTAMEAGHTRPLLIAVDQENGVVTRVKPPIAAQLPGSMAIGASGSTEDAIRVSNATGELLSALGINMNYAPCCDVNTEPSNPVIGVRSPGDDGVFVGRITSALAQGLREKNIVPCVKHFPGHGDTKVDSHCGVPTINKTREQLEGCELIPFRRAVAEGIEAVMASHVVISALDDSRLPVSVNKKAVNLLRQELQYDGLIVTDCLEMDAIRVQIGTEKGAVMALAAGVDCPMICHTYDVQVRAYEKAFNACKNGMITLDQVSQSVSRVNDLKSRFLDWESTLRQRSVDVVAQLTAKHRDLASEIYAGSVTLIRDDQHALPLSNNDLLVYVYPCGKALHVSATGSGETTSRIPYMPPEFLEILKLYNPELIECPFYDDGTLDESAKARISQADAVILASRNANMDSNEKLIGVHLADHAKRLISIATCSPYDFIRSSIKTCIAMYEPTPEAFQAAADIIFGVNKAIGTLPVCKQPPLIPIHPFDPQHDMARVIGLWHMLLPQYAVPADRLPGLLDRPNGSHFTVYLEGQLAGFIATYVNEDRPTAYISALLVQPEYQSRGIGTALVDHARRHLKAAHGARSITIGSSFPRFFLGVPLDIRETSQNFFIHRGFVPAKGPSSRDYTSNLQTYQAPERVLQRAAAAGVTFSPWRKDLYDEGIAKIKELWGADKVWIGAYERLAQADRYEQVMVAIDDSGEQLGWTLMQELGLGMTNDLAFMSLLGERTGQIGCVGVHPDARSKGIGLALVASAAMDLKKRGMERVFIDWTTHINFYEKAGFEVWREYRPMTIREFV
ncbi:tyrosinase/acetyltransferase [Emydomyces testavorans]|uniref:Tyrosinase/acetyltransferase n=1 Tax=Emydomyces testavorans TaxID=2070801 RepID=A0AAF0IKS8_9EURO|nr:tyrosinase/acetyltransferase [Emydomyces testavorans]